MALFHLLLRSGHPFHVAHINHGWREESLLEAEKLAQICLYHNIKYHLLSTVIEGKNLEDRSRIVRQNFFAEVCKNESLNAVFLAHHADDQAETVLKRIFEGASLNKLTGLLPKTTIGSLTIYRPLLNIRKTEILTWLNEQKISFFRDNTNNDHRFLRGRMRATLLPSLSKHFGKNIEMNLCRLATSASELSEFLEENLQPLKQKIVETQNEIFLNFSDLSLPKFIFHAIVRELFQKANLSVSHHVIESIYLHIKQKKGPKSLRVKKNCVKIFHGTVKIEKSKLS